MQYTAQWFREQICGVLLAINVNNVDGSLVDAVPNEMLTNRYVLHLAVGMWIVGTSNGPLIVAEDRSWRSLWESNLSK